LATINGEIDIHVVVVGRDEDRPCLHDAGLVEDVEVSSIAVDIIIHVFRQDTIFFDNIVGDVLLLKGLCRRVSYASAAKNEGLGIAGEI